MSGHRLPAGGLIDRTRPLHFTFDGRGLAGHPGDTLASALLASGVMLVGRSFKYHRPRGIVAAGPDEPNALVELRSGARREPNTKATEVELFNGLEATSQNRWPSLDLDLMAVNGLFSRLFVAGFYYKTFKWPSALWERLYEPVIRRAAGLGRLSGLPDPDTYEVATAHCDVLVVGAGPAGLMAALAAGRAGARVILAESDPRLGGALLRERHVVGDRAGPDWVDGVEAELSALPEVRILRRTTVVGAYDGGTVAALEKVADHRYEPRPGEPRQRLWTIVAQRCVVAAGATERPIVLAGNDRPGVMLAGAARTYAVRHGVAVGRRIVIATANDGGWRAAADLAVAGVEIAAVVDARREVAPDLLIPLSHTRQILGAVVREVHGRRAVAAATIAKAAGGGTDRIVCDALLTSGGWQPNAQLTTHLGARPVWNETIAAFGAATPPPGMTVAGAAAGVFDLAGALRTGARAGAVAAEAAGFAAKEPEVPETAEERTGVAPLWHVAGGRAKAFVDLQHDVTADDVALAAREGYVSVEHLKRYTTLGMATDQGRTANLNGLAILAELTKRTIPETGIVTARPPVVPVAIGAFAGLHRGTDFRPVKHPPSHAFAAARGASFVEVGPWIRAQWYPQDGETDWLASVDREVRAVRSHAGVTCMSTLGKFEIAGPDAAAFLTRVYANSVMKLAVGRCAYGLMLREDGFALDDGTIARLGAERFLVTCSTAHVGKVHEHLEYARQVLYPALDVTVQGVTEQWAQIALAGPASREILAGVLDGGVDLSAFPFLQCAETTVLGGVRARLFRISFSGERAYEIAVPTRRGSDLMHALGALGATPYGTEAVGVLRIEKGHPAGAEFNGQTTAHDLGLAGFATRSHPCIGRIMAARPALTDPARGRLVGLKPRDPSARLRAGAHLLPTGAAATAGNDQGYITSVAHSPTLGHWIGLGLLATGDTRHGEIVRAHDPVRGGDVEVEVVAPCFVDPEGRRARD